MFKIVSTERIAPKEYDFWVEAPRIAARTKPGQFVVIRTDEKGERIPLTIADFNREKGLIRIIFQAVGKTTAAMAALKAGAYTAAGAGVLALVALAGGYAVAGASATAYTVALMGAAGSRRKLIQFHVRCTSSLIQLPQ